MSALLLVTLVLSVLCLYATSAAFVVSHRPHVGRHALETAHPNNNNNDVVALFMSKTYSADELQSVGYTARIPTPLGVVFGENGDPYSGLVIDDIVEDSHGLQAGLRVGDQLLSVNGQSVVGEDFDRAMGLLKASSSGATVLTLQLYRGTVRSLVILLDNMFPNNVQDDDDVAVVMDENYESPVKVEVSEEEESLDVGKVFKAIGSLLASDDEPKQPQSEKKESRGLFGGLFSGETIQLEGDDAAGLKGSPRRKRDD